MPKLKPTPTAVAGVIFEQNIRARATTFGCRSGAEIADKIGMPHSTYNRRIREPSLWNLAEIAMAAHALKTSMAWLLTDHSKEEMT